jgi:DNA repair exonuclease SbcCD ATPase subunit
MKKIIFKKISVKNFLSVGSEPVVIEFKSGLHIITGLNKDKEDRRNGVGKSTIADAIYFAIFGDTLRELKKEHIVNNTNRENCEIILDFDIEGFERKDEYKIVRMLEPSRCYIYKNGEDKTRDSIVNTTEYIFKKINCSPDIFQNCVIMTVNNTVPFMAKKKIEKRKFIEGIFNLEVFGTMLQQLREEYNESKKNFDIESTKCVEIESNLASQVAASEAYNKERDVKRQKYITRKENNTKELQSLSENAKEFAVLDVKKIEKDIDALTAKAQKIDQEVIALRDKTSSYRTQIELKEKTHKHIGTDKDVCPTCLRGLEDKDRHNIKEEKQKIKQDISNFESKIASNLKKEEESSALELKLYGAVDSLKGKINSFNLEQKELENIKLRINQLNLWQKELDVDLAEVSKANNQHNANIEAITRRLEEVKALLEKTKMHLNMLDAVKFVLSEEGVKSYIVKKILQLFNSKLAYYLKKMDANCICIFNEYFEEEIIDEKGKPCSYFNFSGAERKNIDLACLFAFMDIRRLQGNVAFNFSVYDELFDSSLDEKGVELVLGILRERIEKYNECIMVISHRKESVKFASGDIIYLEKKNGITKRVEYSDY